MLLKIVIDTNIWVSYFINARADYLIKWILDHSLTVYTSTELAEEIEEAHSRIPISGSSKNKTPL